MSNLVQAIFQVVHQRWWLATLVPFALACASACVRIFESEAARKKRLEQRRKKELRALADRIATYGRNVRQQFPNGAVVVSEEDLAAQMRKGTDSVVTALDVLLTERKVQRTQLTGYWRLNA
jgi:hypothetical protein